MTLPWQALERLLAAPKLAIEITVVNNWYENNAKS
jgi:hypothetical protein